MSENNLTRCIKPVAIIIDNFYNNPDETRKFALAQEFNVYGNYPGSRTISHATEEIKNIIDKFMYPYGEKIVEFRIDNTEENYNGCFQYATSRDRSWVHVDKENNWAGVLFLTPDAPVSSGTGLYKYIDGTRSVEEVEIKNNKELIDRDSQDMTRWELVDKIGNVYNRLVLFNSKLYHSSLEYFGSDLESGRLFQVFFFSTNLI